MDWKCTVNICRFAIDGLQRMSTRLMTDTRFSLLCWFRITVDSLSLFTDYDYRLHGLKLNTSMNLANDCCHAGK